MIHSKLKCKTSHLKRLPITGEEINTTHLNSLPIIHTEMNQTALKIFSNEIKIDKINSVNTESHINTHILHFLIHILISIATVIVKMPICFKKKKIKRKY